MAFDDTYTDHDFKRRLKEANEKWIADVPGDEPDLAVDGLYSSFIARVLALFSRKGR